MELRQLKYFLAICETKNFTKAAQKLYISQPALTNAINALESELGVRLFLRSSKSVTLTPTGQTFYVHASQVVWEVDHALTKIRSIREDSVIRIAVHPLLGQTVMPFLSRLFSDHYPQYQTSFLFCPNKAIADVLEKGSCTYGILLGASGESHAGWHQSADIPCMLMGESTPGQTVHYLLPEDSGNLHDQIRMKFPEKARISSSVTETLLPSWCSLSGHMAVFPLFCVHNTIHAAPFDNAVRAGIFLLENQEAEARLPSAKRLMSVIEEAFQ